MEIRTFRGSPAEVGKAQGEVAPALIQERFNQRMKRPHNFQHPYFRKNLEFMRREFPDFMEQMEAFGTAAGFKDLEHTYFHHIYDTGRQEEACSAFGILLDRDGPALLTTNDAVGVSQVEELVGDGYLAVFPDARPHGLAGIMGLSSITVGRSVNDAGLLTGWASGHRKFNWPDNPEHLNLYITVHLLSQHCANCEDVRHFLKQYRISGLKGINGTAVDAQGNMVGIELESENIAFREPKDGMVLETNHWQHPDLQAPSRAAAPDFWQSPYYYNSLNRLQYLAYYREEFKKMRTLNELIDFSFDVDAPGRLLQSEGHNIADWVTSNAIFMTSRDRCMRVHSYPLDKDQYTEVAYPS